MSVVGVSPVGDIAIGVVLKGGFETGAEVDGTVWFTLTGSGSGVELMVGVETGGLASGKIYCIGLASGAAIIVIDGITVGMETFLVGDADGSIISNALTTCPVSV